VSKHGNELITQLRHAVRIRKRGLRLEQAILFIKVVSNQFGKKL